MPYLWAQAVKTHNTGIPMMRAMVIDYADDPACLTLDRQYMFGDNILVAPIFNDRGLAEYYLPEGKWTDIISGKVYGGGKFYKETYDYFGLPCLAKPNSIIAHGNFKRGFEYDYLENAEFVIYQPEDGKEISAPIYDVNANKVFELKAVRRGDIVEVTFPKTEKPFSVKIAGDESVSVAVGEEKVDLKIE